MPAVEKTPDNDLGEAVAVYLDDICLATMTVPEMLRKLLAMFNRIRASGMLLKA